MTPEVSARRIRTRATGRQAAAAGTGRQVLAVRYPWAGWGADIYAHRSLFDGVGEPVYDTEPTPSRASMRNVLLTTANSKREKITWKHSHVWNNAAGAHQEDRPDSWWIEAANPHPINTGSVDYGSGTPYLSPQPMSDVAFYARRPDRYNDAATDWHQLAANLRLPGIEIFHTPPAIGEEMSWSTYDVEPEIFHVRRKCSRVLCYKDVTHTAGVIDFNPTAPFAVLRRACGGNTPAVTVDKRWEPFGWADVLDYSDGYQVDTTYTTAPQPPPHTSAITATQSYNFATGDLAQLSAAKVSQGFVYASPHNDNNPFLWSYLENDQPFDLIIEADFYRYKWWKFNSESAYTDIRAMELHATGFAGIYGTCHAIF